MSAAAPTAIAVLTHIVKSIVDACDAGIAAGWMCGREHAGIRYGRVVKPGEATHGFSVEVVEMKDMVVDRRR